MDRLFAEGFPAFTADPEVKKYIARVRDYFPQLDVILVGEDGHPAATGWGVPIPWTDDVADLPPSFADILPVAVEAHESEPTRTRSSSVAGSCTPNSKALALRLNWSAR